MPIVGLDTSSYKARTTQSRFDGDGKELILARAHATLTAKTPVVARIGYDGWRTLALFDTGSASTTAASHPQYVFAVPNEPISSDTDGWLQIGGVCTSVTLASQSATTGNYFRWSDATVTGTTAASATTIGVDVVGVCMTTASSGNYDIYLLGSRHLCFGTT